MRFQCGVIPEWSYHLPFRFDMPLLDLQDLASSSKVQNHLPASFEKRKSNPLIDDPESNLGKRNKNDVALDLIFT